MNRRITVSFTEETAKRIEKAKPKDFSMTTFIKLLIHEYLDKLDREVRLPAYRVGAENISIHTDTNTKSAKPANAADVRYEDSNFSSKKENLKNSIVVLGEDVGKESEENPKNPPLPYDFETSIPDKLKRYVDKIAAFWRVKKGTKNRLAWSLQMVELEKILDNLGESVLIEQLDQACMSGTWKQINYNRTVQYSDKEEEKKITKHPQSRIFTAKDGFLE